MPCILRNRPVHVKDPLRVHRIIHKLPCLVVFDTLLVLPVHAAYTLFDLNSVRTALPGIAPLGLIPTVRYAAQLNVNLFFGNQELHREQ